MENITKIWPSNKEPIKKPSRGGDYAVALVVILEAACRLVESYEKMSLSHFSYDENVLNLK